VRSALVAVVAVVIVLVGIIGYAVVGLAYASTRVANADRSLNTVVSHQNTLNSTFKDIDKQFNGLSSSSTFNPTQSRTEIDKFVRNAIAAGTMVDRDDAALVVARAGLEWQKWLTAFSRSDLDREAARIGHARKALSNAKSVAADYVKDGDYFRAFLDLLLDLDGTLTLSANGDIAAAKASLPKLKADVDSGLQHSTAPGLPSDVHSMMLDFVTLVADFGTLLDAVAANDNPTIVTAGRAVEADGTKVGSYDFTKMATDMVAYYKPRVDAFNSELAMAKPA
jgi:soluble cytochrome b562